MTEEDLKMVADLEKAGGTMTLDDLSDKLEGGTNFNVFCSLQKIEKELHLEPIV